MLVCCLAAYAGGQVVMNTVLNKHSVLYIVLSEWVPPLITILIGGVLASVLFPRWQDQHARYHAREDRKLALAEEFSRNITRYLVCWRRLRTIAELELSRSDGLTEAEFERKKKFVEARDTARDALMDTLCSLGVYFSNNVRASIDDFIRWDEACCSSRINDLPPREDYTKKRQELIAVVHREVAR